MKRLIIVMLCMFATASFAQFGTRNARTQQCVSNLKQIGVAVQLYMMDHDDRLPAKLTDLTPYLPAKIFQCPRSKNRYILIGNISGNNNNSSIPLAMDRIGYHQGIINVVMRDGHAVIIRHNAKNYQGLINSFKGLNPAQKQQLLSEFKRLDSAR